jgi:hypothetical protein
MKYRIGLFIVFLYLCPVALYAQDLPEDIQKVKTQLRGALSSGNVAEIYHAIRVAEENNFLIAMVEAKDPKDNILDILANAVKSRGKPAVKGTDLRVSIIDALLDTIAIYMNELKIRPKDERFKKYIGPKIEALEEEIAVADYALSGYLYRGLRGDIETRAVLVEGPAGSAPTKGYRIVRQHGGLLDFSTPKGTGYAKIYEAQSPLLTQLHDRIEAAILAKNSALLIDALQFAHAQKDFILLGIHSPSLLVLMFQTMRQSAVTDRPGGAFVNEFIAANLEIKDVIARSMQAGMAGVAEAYLFAVSRCLSVVDIRVENEEVLRTAAGLDPAVYEEIIAGEIGLIKSTADGSSAIAVAAAKEESRLRAIAQKLIGKEYTRDTFLVSIYRSRWLMDRFERVKEALSDYEDRLRFLRRRSPALAKKMVYRLINDLRIIEITLRLIHLPEYYLRHSDGMDRFPYAGFADLTAPSFRIMAGKFDNLGMGDMLPDILPEVTRIRNSISRSFHLCESTARETGKHLSEVVHRRQEGAGR